MRDRDLVILDALPDAAATPENGMSLPSRAAALPDGSPEDKLVCMLGGDRPIARPACTPALHLPTLLLSVTLFTRLLLIHSPQTLRPHALSIPLSGFILHPFCASRPAWSLEYGEHGQHLRRGLRWFRGLQLVGIQIFDRRNMAHRYAKRMQVPGDPQYAGLLILQALSPRQALL